MADASKHNDDVRSKNVPAKKAAKDRRLDEALQDTFPASDPVATNCPTGREKPKARIDRQPPKLPKQ